MENTSQLLFQEDSNPKWYVASGESLMGPLSLTDIYEKIAAGQVSWAHYIWKAGDEDWKRICDTQIFATAVPGAPSAAVREKARESANRLASPAPRVSAPPAFKGEDRAWFLHYNDTQFGPFSEEEIGRFLKIGKIHSRVYAWHDGMPNWDRLERITDFAAVVAEAKSLLKTPTPPTEAVRVAPEETQTQTKTLSNTQIPVPNAAAPGTAEQRRAPRRPLVARLLMINERDSAVNIAVCRDVSVGGMQVLTDRVPGPVGTRIKLNVSPAGDDPQSPSKLQPFVAEGVIVRTLEDGRGFSFRFERLPAEARSAIEEFIATSD